MGKGPGRDDKTAAKKPAKQAAEVDVVAPDPSWLLPVSRRRRFRIWYPDGHEEPKEGRQEKDKGKP